MTNGSLIWLIIFIIAALLFFVTAVAIIILGMRDLKNLLSKPETLAMLKYEIKKQNNNKTFQPVQVKKKRIEQGRNG